MRAQLQWRQDCAGSLQAFCFHSEGNGGPLEGFKARRHRMRLALNRAGPVRRRPGAETGRPVLPESRTEIMMERDSRRSGDGQVLGYLLAVDRMFGRNQGRCQGSEFEKWKNGVVMNKGGDDQKSRWGGISGVWFWIYQA